MEEYGRLLAQKLKDQVESSESEALSATYRWAEC
jgi:hypothetical protein